MVVAVVWVCCVWDVYHAGVGAVDLAMVCAVVCVDASTSLGDAGCCCVSLSESGKLI